MSDNDPITVEIVRDGRLRTRIHWEWNGDHVRIRAPRRVPKRELDKHVAEIVEEVKRKRSKVRARADTDLDALARGLEAVSTRHADLRAFLGEAEGAIGSAVDAARLRRLVELAQHGETIVSQAVVDSLPDGLEGWTFEHLPRTLLKGNGTTAQLYLAHS